MALIVSQQPESVTPAYNDQFFTALSDQIGVSDFKYIVTYEVNASGVVKTYDILQRPDGYCVFNPKEWVINYINRSYFDPKIEDTTYFALATGKTAGVVVSIKEYYSGVIQSTTTIIYTVYDACLTKKDFDNYTIVSNPFGSESPIDNRISLRNGSHFVHFIRNNARFIDCEMFNSFGVSQGTFSFTFSTGKCLYADLGYKTCVANGLTPLDGYYLVYKIANLAHVPFFTTTIVFKDICTNHNEYCLHFLTRTGKIDHFNFELLSQENVSKKNTTVRLSPNKLTSGVYGSKHYDRELHTVSAIETKTITLNTNWITELQSQKLEELWDSPVIYLKDLNADEFYSVTIKSTSYKKSKHINEPLFNYTVECEYAVQENRQRSI